MNRVLAALLLAFGLRAQSFVATPITDLRTGTYKGFEGGLYENGSNTVPADHDARVRAAVSQIVPRDSQGIPTAAPVGRIAFASLGMSNTNDEWCSGDQNGHNCASYSFTGAARSNPAVNRSLIFVDGGIPGQPAEAWTSLSSPSWSTLISRLELAGATRNQVQALWLFQADDISVYPAPTLPNSRADAYFLEAHLGTIIRNARIVFPQLQIVFITSMTYTGYDNCSLVPEPYAYEGGFAVKWLVHAQVNQERTNIRDAIAGDLSQTVAPEIVWGAYQWADGNRPRLDGFNWLSTDVLPGGCHPSASGVTKTANLLMNYMLSSNYSLLWFRP